MDWRCLWRFRSALSGSFMVLANIFLRGQVHVFGEARVPLVATYHPAYLLRSPTDKRKAWEDLKFAREVCARVER